MLPLDLNWQYEYIRKMKYSLFKNKVFGGPGSLFGLLLSILILGSGAANVLAAEPATSARPSWQAAPPPLDEGNPQAALVQAKKRFQQAEADFTTAENREANAALNPPQKTATTTSEPAAASAPQAAQQAAPQASDPRAEALQGSPETGYAGTWKDPATGDIVTSVIAPTPQPSASQTQNYPIIVEPQVSGTGWGGNWSGSNGSWNPEWPQWPGYPGNNGYPVPPPTQPSYPKPEPPFPGPVSGNWHQPFPVPQPPNQAPPFPPGYRPLRPMQPISGGVIGTPGVQPKPGFSSNPTAMPSIPGYNPPAMIPGYNPPAVIPGYTPMPQGEGRFPIGPSNPGLSPQPGPVPNGPGPGFRPLPMQPGGSSWGQHFPGGRNF